MKLTYKISALVISVLFVLSERVAAEDSNKEIPGSSHEIQSDMDQGLSEEIAPETKLSELLTSSEVKLNLRNYYFNRGKPQAIDSYAWAQGGILSHKMGRIGGVFSMNTELMGSYPLDAPEDHTGTLILDKNQDSITTFGVVNPRLTYEGQVLSAYRQRYNLPYVNEQDNRMLPNTFEGYTIGQPLGTSKKFQYIVGYIDSMKKRDSEDFVSMSDAAGVSQIEQGMLVGGGRAYFIPEWSLAAINYYVEDVFNIVYAESIYKLKLNDQVEQTFSGQYSNQSSVGEDLLFGESEATGFWGLQSATSYKGFVLKLAVNLNDDSNNIQTPYGTYPGYNSSIVQDFNRAGENSWQVGLSYDLANVGLDGFKVASSYVRGTAAVDPVSGEDLPDENETDVTIDYRPAEGILNGFWLRLRSGTVHDEDAGQTQDFRVIVNYEIPIYGPEKAL